MPLNRSLSLLYKRLTVKTVISKMLFSFTLLFFISVSIFSEHTCHQEEFLQIAQENASSPQIQGLSINDEDGHFCIACFWQFVSHSTGNFEKISISQEYSNQNFEKTTGILYFRNFVFSFQKRAPPLI